MSKTGHEVLRLHNLSKQKKINPIYGIDIVSKVCSEDKVAPQLVKRRKTGRVLRATLTLQHLCCKVAGLFTPDDLQLEV